MVRSGPAVALRSIVTAERIGKGLWSVVAQALSSGSNFALQAGLVVTLEPVPFGTAVIGFSCYYLALALGRAWVGDPLVAIGGHPGTSTGPDATTVPDASTVPDATTVPDALWRRSRRRLLALGAAAGVAVALVAAAAPVVRIELLALAVSAPALLVQDGYRYRSWAHGRPQRAAALDALWVVVFGLVVAVGVVAGPGADTAVPTTARIVVGGWLAGGLVSALAGAAVTGTSGAPAAGPAIPGGAAITGTGRAPSRPGGDTGDDRWRAPAAGDEEAARLLAGSQIVLAADANALPVAVAALAGAEVTGGVRAASLPFLPVASVVGAVRVLTLPILRRAVVDDHPFPTVAKVVGLDAILAAGTAAAGLIAVHAVPAGWLGPTGELIRPWYPLAAVAVSARMLALPMADLLSLGAGTDRVIRYRLATAALDWAATLAGALTFGIAGALAAKAAALVVAAGLWARATVTACRRAGVVSEGS